MLPAQIADPDHFSNIDDLVANDVGFDFAASEELKNQKGAINDELTRESVEKIVADFRVSLQKELDKLGENSNAEKHINELVHRANFRFSDLQTWINRSRKELTHCQKLKEILQQTLLEQLQPN